jgi:hypothetical protein
MLTPIVAVMLCAASLVPGFLRHVDIPTWLDFVLQFGSMVVIQRAMAVAFSSGIAVLLLVGAALGIVSRGTSAVPITPAAATQTPTTGTA